MIIKNIKAQGFRNLKNIEFIPNEGVNLFYGHNGQGKTNLLECIYLVSKGSSFRPGKIDQWRSKDIDTEEVFSLDFQIQDGHLGHNIRLAWENNRKVVLIDGKKTTTGRLVQLLPTILFSPESLTAIKDGPEKRRSLIDEIILSSYEEQHLCQNFKKSLKSRNAFLRASKEKGSLEESLYNSVTVLFLNFSTQLSMARINYLKKLDPYIKKAIKIIFDGELEFNFEYKISDRLVKDWEAKDILSLHQNRVSDLQSAELKFGSSLVGAHKHDIKFMLNEKDSRFFSSQGQQRGLILSIKMAEVLYKFSKGIKPVLLLDDVLSELDAKKRNSLLDFLKSFETQIFITTTEPFNKKELEGHHFLINQGNIVSYDKEQRNELNG